MPAKRIIILENKTNPNEGNEAARRFTVVLWADVPLERQGFYATTAVSAWKGASSLENGDLQAGRVAEKRHDVAFRFNISLAEAQANLQTIWQSYQDEITTLNPWNRYGTLWDGTTWTLVSVA